MKWEQRIPELLQRYEALTARLADPAIFADPAALREVGREHAELTPLVETARRLDRIRSQLAEARELAESSDDSDLRELATAEAEDLAAQETGTAESLRQMLLPKDPLADRAAVVEIRAGTGGEEAALFAADLFRMYAKYAESRRWKVEMISTNATGLGGDCFALFYEARTGRHHDRQKRHRVRQSPTRPQPVEPLPQLGRQHVGGPAVDLHLTHVLLRVVQPLVGVARLQGRAGVEDARDEEGRFDAN